MKTARLIGYGVMGIIAGLLVENGTLRLKQKAGKKARSLGKAAKEKLSGN